MGEYKHMVHNNVFMELCGDLKFIVGEKKREAHELLTAKAIERVKEVIKEKSFDLLILDEILYVLQSLLQRAYIATHMKKKKHEFDTQKKTLLFINY